ncbi:MAG: ATP-binding cassette domain-containing protein, partial [Endomicrobium sp.]|nr:ATP-binding cassette domain-containing protein [Endomicrobium sp.]
MFILSVKNLSVDYKASFGIVNAVKNVSFDIEKGQSYIIVGRSGSGKSTVASAIMDLSEIDGGEIKSGSVIYDGKDFLKLSFDEKRKIRGKKISMIFQDPQSYLNPVIRIGRQIFEAYEVHNPKASKEEARKKAKEVLKKVKLEDTERIFNSYPHQLSGGQ